MSARSTEEWLTDQRGVVAAWQLIADGHSEATVRHALEGLRCVHDGVYLSGHAPPTDWQLWKAATLTAPGTRLAEWSAASFHGMRGNDRMPTTVKRVGTSGIRRYRKRPDRLASLTVYHSTSLDLDSITVDDIWMLSVARTMLDLTPRMTQERTARMLREVLRLKLATPADLYVVLMRHRGARGTARLRALVDQYAPLPFGDVRSDPEILAVALLLQASIEQPSVNIRVAGEEGDLVWLKWRLIVELDGPQYHQFPVEDARKQAIWEAAGFTVRRLPTDDVYFRPHLLLEAATRPLPRAA